MKTRFSFPLACLVAAAPLTIPLASPAQTDSTNSTASDLVDNSAAVGDTNNADASVDTTGAALPSVPCVPPPAGIVAWWRGESNLVDSIGGNDLLTSPATPVGASGVITFTPGEVGTAFSFPSGGLAPTYLVAPPIGDLDVGPGAGLTIESWIRPTSTAYVHPIVEWNDNRFNIGAGLVLSGAGGILEAQLTDTNVTPARHITINTAGSVITNSGWQHVALTFNRTNGLVVIYVNGASVAQTNVGAFTPVTRAPVYIGYAPNAGQFIGAIDEPTIYNRALTAPEIASIYHASSAGKCPPPPPACVPAPAGIVGWWRGQSNTVDTVNGDNAVITNSVTYTNGEVGTCFKFINGSLRIPASSNLNVGLGSGMTVELWMNGLTTSPGVPTGIFAEWNNGPAQGAYFAVSPSSVNPSLDNRLLLANLIDTNGVPHTIQSPPGLVARAQWQHVAVTYDRASGLAALYVNGSQVARTNLGVFTPRTAGDFYLAHAHPNLPVGAFPLSGLMDEISIYNRALAPAEIRSIMLARGAGKCLEPPVITQQPLSQVVNLGDTATFSVTADGTPTLHYQWFFDGNLIPGATDPTLVLPDAQTNESGTYFVLVTNMLGAAISSNATLRVNLPPVADATATAPLVISANGSNAPVVLDGSRSYDLDGDALQFSWFVGGDTSATATGAVAVVVLPVGTNSITLLVSDGYASDQQTISIDVITTAQAVELLKDLVTSDVDRKQPLLATLSAAIASIDRSNPTAAVNQLQAFQNQVIAQVAPLDPVLAQTFINDAQQIIDILGGTAGNPHANVTLSAGQSHGKVHLQIPASSGSTYIIEASSDLVNWQMIGVATNAQDGTFGFDDDATQSGSRFYRVVTPQQ